MPAMKNQLFFIVLSLLVFAACKKQKTTPNPGAEQTITPLSYFPAYPGSYWKYVDLNGDSTMSSTSAEYEKDSYNFPMATYVSDTFLVPFYDGIPIWRYEAHTGPISHSGSYPFTRLVSDSLPVGSNWMTSFWMGIELRRRIIAKDTVITIFGQDYSPTIVVEEYMAQGPYPNLRINRRFFTKDIGLVREDLFNTSDSLVNTRYITDYFIHH